MAADEAGGGVVRASGARCQSGSLHALPCWFGAGRSVVVSGLLRTRRGVPVVLVVVAVGIVVVG